MRQDEPLSHLPAMFSAGDLSRVVVADSEGRLTGVITKPDLMAALFTV
ncbi:MAG: CBS domain-containing protein [Asticcacaulis sp.]